MNCGEENPARARFCMACSAMLTAAPAHDTRKTVTIVFSDLVGSTSLGEALDPESVREVLASYFDRMQAVLERHGGTVEKFIGDAVMAVFGLPRLHEDDALRAVRAAWEMQVALSQLNDQLEARWGVRLTSRTGVHTGEVVAGDPSAGQRLVTGDTVNTAARLEQAAPPGAVLLGETTWRLVREFVRAEPIGPLTVKGKAERISAYGLREGPEAAAPPERPMDTSLVGREEELARLEAAVVRTRDQRRCDLVLVVGEPGVGKSRLLHEFTRRVDKVEVLMGRCPPYGEGITLWPLVEVVRQAAGITDDHTAEDGLARLRDLLAGHPDAELVADRVGACAGLSTEPYPLEEMFWGMRQLLVHLAAAGPVVAVFEDVHWAQDAFLVFLEQTSALAEEGPVLLVCSARRDLLDQRPRWADRFAMVSLEPLSTDQIDLLIAAQLGTSRIPAAVQAQVREAAGGNPLFVGQMLSMLVDDGYLARQNGSWSLTADLATLSVPPTISALLAARLDGLPGEERAVIERAAVPGPVIERAALWELCPDGLRSRLDPVLLALVHRRFLQPGEREDYLFRHVLIRDAAYAGMLKRLRAELHERFAAWLEATAGGHSSQIDELVGYHLEQVYRYRAELGPLDPEVVEVGRRAGRRLAAAGRRALARGDVAAAANLLGRAVALVPADEPERLEWRIDLGGALREANQLQRAIGVLDDAIRSARSSGDARLQSRAVVERVAVDMYLETPGWADRARQAATRMIPLLEALGDQQGLAKAWRMMSWAHLEQDLAGWDEASWRSIEHARRAGDRREEVEVLAGLALSAALGAAPVQEGIRRCQEILEAVHGHLRVEGFVLGYLARLYGLAGKFDLARGANQRAQSAVEKTGAMVWMDATALEGAEIERLAGDPVSAEEACRDIIRRIGQREDQGLRPWASIELARALYDQDRIEEALPLAEEGTNATEHLDRVLALALQAKILATLGRPDHAATRAMEVMDGARVSDHVVIWAQALMDAAEALLLTGHLQKAKPVIQEALQLSEQKQSPVLLERARRLAGLTG
jgi:class 3 adenylate cyclase/tetratricopeptide (TPR) repeat protein